MPRRKKLSVEEKALAQAEHTALVRELYLQQFEQVKQKSQTERHSAQLAELAKKYPELLRDASADGADGSVNPGATGSAIGAAVSGVAGAGASGVATHGVTGSGQGKSGAGQPAKAAGATAGRTPGVTSTMKKSTPSPSGRRE
eukprot:TRINITY_DN23467_c0_g1_i1.p1 TRINITY_DN23467_c0_g1~~TRINITY_DN23467_c0_g1_i1.p1  ORF type:complete len:143 (-),score=10.71 TRINITY_DN23467_c0_g1_i1:311-739(-)